MYEEQILEKLEMHRKWPLQDICDHCGVDKKIWKEFATFFVEFEDMVEAGIINRYLEVNDGNGVVLGNFSHVNDIPTTLRNPNTGEKVTVDMDHIIIMAVKVFGIPIEFSFDNPLR